MSSKPAPNQFFSLDLPNFPTFKAAASQHRTITFIFFLIGYSLVTFALIAVVTLNQSTLVSRPPARAFENLPLATAYGSQRHVFTKDDGWTIAIYLSQDKNVMIAVSEDGEANWQELPQSLTAETVDNLSGAQDKEGNLHLAYEQNGKIVYQKINTSVQPWLVSEKVNLDTSHLGHRPTIILDQDSQLPMVIWSSEFRGTPLRGARILFMAAKADPTRLSSWCDGQRSLCGQGAFYFLKGATDVLGSRASYSVLHPTLTQMPESGDLYLWWTEHFPSGKTNLNLVIAEKDTSGFKWGSVSSQDQVSSEANFTLSAVSNKASSQVVVTYVNSQGKAKALVYGKGKEKEELGNLGEIGDQFSLTESEGKYYLFYRNLESRVGIRKYNGSWSSEIWQGSEIGGYPSAPASFSIMKVPFIYVTSGNTVKRTSYGLLPPTPTATP